MLRIRSKKGQSTLEYIILVTAVIVVIIYFLVGRDSKFQATMNSSLNQATQGMVQMGGKFSDAFAPAVVNNTTP